MEITELILQKLLELSAQFDALKLHSKLLILGKPDFSVNDIQGITYESKCPKCGETTISDARGPGNEPIDIRFMCQVQFPYQEDENRTYYKSCGTEWNHRILATVNIEVLE